MNKEHIIMNQGDVKRYEIIQKTIKKELKTSEASEILNLTERQIRRLKSKVRKYGIKGLIHANRGKPSSRKVPDKETDRIIKIIKEKYWDFGPTFATEKLEENHRIKRDPKTIRNIMIKEGLWQPKRKKKEKPQTTEQNSGSL